MLIQSLQKHMSKSENKNAKQVGGIFESASGTIEPIIVQKNGVIRARIKAKKKRRNRKSEK